MNNKYHSTEFEVCVSPHAALRMLLYSIITASELHFLAIKDYYDAESYRDSQSDAAMWYDSYKLNEM